MIPSPLTLVLFRRDLRLSDQPAVHAAMALGHPILPLVIADPQSPLRPRGAAADIFYQAALLSLDKSLHGLLRLYHGSLIRALSELKALTSVAAVCWNQGSTPQEQQQDSDWQHACQQAAVPAHMSMQASLLWEPHTVHKADGTLYKVFTPFYKKGCLELAPPPRPLLPRAAITPTHLVAQELLGVKASQAFLPLEPWAKKVLKHWDPSENGAKALWKRFATEASATYKEGRNFLDRRGTTELSPYLACGIVSPHQLLDAATDLPDSPDRAHFLQELGWREFSYYLLHHFPQLPSQNWNPLFNAFPWDQNEHLLALWQQGQTGIPIVDAGMRQMWETGYMHNRARMIVGSFLVKNLLLPWQKGEQWFWDCLVDADLANNSASWQWVAGSGADAAPYFRIFNATLQAEKFDPQGDYIRRYVPELAALPAKYLIAPWEYPSEIARFGVVLGQHYPRPCVCLKASREKALQAFERLKKL